MTITSKNNQQIKRIRRLHRRKYRHEDGLFLVEGVRWVREALTQPERVETVIYCPALLTSGIGYEAVSIAYECPDIQVLETNEDVFRSFTTRQNPVGIAAVMRQQWYPLDFIGSENSQVWVALNAVQYPGNLGTILRTCDAVGAAGVILIDNATDPYDPSAVRAGITGIFTQHLIRTDFESLVYEAQACGYAMVGASDDAPVSYRQLHYPRPVILLMGSEGGGLSDRHRAVCDCMVHIPMRGHNDSLNLAVATAVILYEILAQYTL